MIAEKETNLLEEAVWIFLESILSELPIGATDLTEKYGVDLLEYYSYASGREELIWIPEEDFTLFYELLRIYKTECNCQREESLVERFDPEIGAMRLTSDDGKWLDSDSECTDSCMPPSIKVAQNPIDPRFDISPNVSERLFRAMLSIHDLRYIGAKPRSGAYFVKSWAAPFSNDWYVAECHEIWSSISHQGKNTATDGAIILRRAFNLGRAYSDRIWREQHFQTSQIGSKQLDSLQSANDKMAKRSVVRTRDKLHCLKNLWDEICQPDSNLLRNDAKAADAIFSNLSKNSGDVRLKSLFIKKTGAPIAQDAIRRHLKTLRNKGAI